VIWSITYSGDSRKTESNLLVFVCNLYFARQVQEKFFIVNSCICDIWSSSMLKNADNNSETDMPSEYNCNKYFEKIIKSNREIFIMSYLLEAPMCGYDIIKKIFIEYNVFLSQGAVYPILYSLEEEKLLYAEYDKGDMRSKKYSLTPRGREIVQTNITEFKSAINYINMRIQI
jgi:DNA-binding PadR family transcriptional regulator